MPTYSYRCPECGHEYQKLQRISDDTRAQCPECSAHGERLISAGGGFVFKGSGFYITDYKRAGEKKEKDTDDKRKAPKADKPANKPKAETKGDAKSGSGDSGKAKPGDKS